MSTSPILAAAKAVSFVCTTDRAAALKFYRDTLGFALVEDTPFALVFDMNGTTLRVSPVNTLAARGFTVLGWDVRDIAATVAALTAAGCVFERYAGYEQDALGIWTAPGSAAKVAWFKDPDGNLLSVAEHGA